MCDNPKTTKESKTLLLKKIYFNQMSFDETLPLRGFVPNLFHKNPGWVGGGDGDGSHGVVSKKWPKIQTDHANRYKVKEKCHEKTWKIPQR